jgi:hypothetical protein
VHNSIDISNIIWRNMSIFQYSINENSFIRAIRPNDEQ